MNPSNWPYWSLWPKQDWKNKMMRIWNPKIVSCFLFLLWAATYGQLNTEKEAQIDSLFQAWNKPNHPGGAIAIMQGDKVVYSKAYGLASMEYLVPNSTGTLFNVASVSKQFSALGYCRNRVNYPLMIPSTNTLMDLLLLAVRLPSVR